jgi:hypothetical protein
LAGKLAAHQPFKQYNLDCLSEVAKIFSVGLLMLFAKGT